MPALSSLELKPKFHVTFRSIYITLHINTKIVVCDPHKPISKLRNYLEMNNNLRVFKQLVITSKFYCEIDQLLKSKYFDKELPIGC
jgi:Na+-transporting NADH:ubiquinone oxidoreductase subunit NqrD